MTKPDTQTLQAMVRLANTEDGKRLIALLADCLKHERESGDIIAGDVQCRWNQGRRQALHELLGYILNAEEILKAEAKARESVPKSF